MKKSTRKLFKIASIISYTTAIVFGLLTLLLLFEEPTTMGIFEEALMLIDKTTTSKDIENMLLSYILFTGFSAYDSYTSGKVYKFFTKANDGQIYNALNSCVFVASFQLLFGIFLLPPITLIAPILGLIGYFNCKKALKNRVEIEVPIIQTDATNKLITLQPQAVQMMLVKINELKQGKSKGLYTDEQYNQKLSKILGGDFS